MQHICENTLNIHKNKTDALRTRRKNNIKIFISNHSNGQS